MTEEEFVNLYETNKSLVKACVYPKIYDKSMVEDVVQEVWLKVWKQKDNYTQDRGAISTWLTMIAESVVSSYLRTRVENQPDLVMDSQLTPPVLDDPEDHPTSGSWIEETIESPYNTAADVEGLDQLVFAGSTLSEQEAAVFNLIYWHGLSYEAVAKKFDIEVSSIGPVVTRLRAKIEKGMRPTNTTYRYHSPGNVWNDWSFKPDGLGNLRLFDFGVCSRPDLVASFNGE